MIFYTLIPCKQYYVLNSSHSDCRGFRIQKRLVMLHSVKVFFKSVNATRLQKCRCHLPQYLKNTSISRVWWVFELYSGRRLFRFLREISRVGVETLEQKSPLFDFQENWSKKTKSYKENNFRNPKFDRQSFWVINQKPSSCLERQ